MRIDKPQITGSIFLNGDTIEDLDSLVTTSSLNSYTGSNNTRLNTIESTTGSLNSYTSSNNTIIGSLQTGTSSLNNYTSSNNTRLSCIEIKTGSYATTGSNTFNGNLTVTGYIDAQELRTTYISSSILYRSGSTKFGDELSDNHSFTGSMLISGSISIPGSNLVSGSAQIDVLSTTNIARLATTGSNIFSGSQIVTGSVCVNGSLSLTTPLSVANGGTGLTTFGAANRIPYSTSATDLTTNSNFTYDGNRLTIPEATFNGTSNYGYIFSVKASTSSGGSGIFIRGTQGGDNTLPTTFGYPYINIGGVESRLNAIQTIGFGFTNGTGGYLSPAEIGYITNSLSGYTNGHLVFATRESTSNVAPDEKMRITNAGNVGIGQSIPTARLHVKGSGNTCSTSALKVDNCAGTNLLNILDNGAATFRNISNSGAPATSGTIVNATLSIDNAFSVMTNIGNLSASPYSVWLQVQDKGNLATTYPLSLQPNGGNVGIGTTAPGTKLDVLGTNGISLGVVNITDTASFAQGVGGKLSLRGKYNTAGDLAVYGAVAGIKENATDGSFLGDLAFYTLPAGGNIAEVMRILSNGNVGIGTANPSSKLHVDGNIAFGAGRSEVYTFSNVAASSGFVNITMPSDYSGFLTVHNRRYNDALPGTYRAYSIFARGITSSFQQIHQFLDGDGASFTITVPSSGVIRITNNYFLDSDIEVMIQYRLILTN